MKKEYIKKMWVADNGDGTFTNPILYTDYSDPDAIRVGSDYFMVASSFCNVPAVPLLHSKDLVNWKVINYIVDRLPFARYDSPAHGCGAWAPSIRYHEGVYYVFIPMPDEGLMMCKTKDPWGKWSEPAYVRKVAGWIDPCPFWDEDGRAYMVSAFAKSRIGFKSYLYITPIEPDCSGITDEGKFVYDGHDTQPTIEGPKLYKRNGYYYIFAPAGGVKSGWQTVLRSKSIYGPYEEKIVLHRGNTQINGPHQGAWVDTPSGEDWFLHFQDVGNAGRIVHLQPMRWEDDWPVIGIHDADGCGEPAICCKKPEVGAVYPADAPEESDFFEGDRLGLQWQWNANYREDWYELEKGKLTLYAQPSDVGKQLCDVGNLLLQKWPAPEFRITTCLYLDRLTEGDVAGMVSLGGCYTAMAVRKSEGRLILQQRTGNWTKDDETRVDLGEVKGDILYIRMFVEKRERIARREDADLKEETVLEGGVRLKEYVRFEIGDSESSLQAVGRCIAAAPGRWVGVKAGLFAVNEENHIGGSVSADYFVFQELE